MDVYVRKKRVWGWDRFFLFIGLPEHHKTNDHVKDEFLTRRQAIRYARANGLNVIIRDRASMEKEHSEMNEFLNIRISNSEMLDNGADDGEWLYLPVNKADLEHALTRLGAADGEYGMDYFITAFESDLPVINRLPIDYIRRKNIDELNDFARELENADHETIEKMNAELEHFTENSERGLAGDNMQLEFITHLPRVKSYAQLGKHYLDSGRVKIPDDLIDAVNVAKLGQLVAQQEKGFFTQHGYVCESVVNEKVIEYSKNDLAGIKNGTEQEKKKRTEKAGKAAGAYTAEEKGVRSVAASEALRGKPIVLESENEQGKVRELKEELKRGIRETFKKDGQYKSFLNTLSKFYNYSCSNNVLIDMQIPDASYVYGAGQWEKNRDRVVKSDERGRGNLIFAPALKKVHSDNLRDVAVPDFKVVEIFDVSQTVGENFYERDMLYKNVENKKYLIEALEKISPVPIGYVQDMVGADGYYNHADRRIVLNEGLGEQQNLKTMIQEIAHARLHDLDSRADGDKPEDNDKIRQLQAESIAYTICQRYGIDNSQYTFENAASWGNDKWSGEKRAYLKTIHKEVKETILGIDSQLQEMNIDYTNEKENKAVEKKAPDRAGTRAAGGKRTANSNKKTAEQGKRGVRSNLAAASKEAAAFNSQRKTQSRNKSNSAQLEV